MKKSFKVFAMGLLCMGCVFPLVDSANATIKPVLSTMNNQTENRASAELLGRNFARYLLGDTNAYIGDYRTIQANTTSDIAQARLLGVESELINGFLLQLRDVAPDGFLRLSVNSLREGAWLLNHFDEQILRQQMVNSNVINHLNRLVEGTAERLNGTDYITINIDW